MAGPDTLGAATFAAAAACTNAPADETSNPVDLLAAVLGCGRLSRDQRVVCKLLCCSKALAAAVIDSCSGQLAADFDPPQKTDPWELWGRCSSQAAWLKSYGHLLRELICTYKMRVMFLQPHLVEGAQMHLQDEADPYGASLLYEDKSALSELLPLLAGSAPNMQKLSGAMAIHLETFGAADCAALGRVTSFTKLQLSIEGAEMHGGPGPILAQLKQLPRLTDCDLSLVGEGPRFMTMDAAGLQHLPTQLTHLGLEVRLGLHDEGLEELISEAGLGELEDMLDEGNLQRSGLDTRVFGTRYPQKQAPMLLGHLTALKELKPLAGHVPQHFLAHLGVRAGDVLPPNLTCLDLHSDKRDLHGLLAGPLAAPTVEPMLALTSLQVLTIHDSSATASQLQQLSSALTAPHGSLREVSLSYAGWVPAAGAAAGWTSLPMVALTVSVKPTVQWWNHNRFHDGEASELAVTAVLTAIGGLTKLRKLTIAGGRFSATQQELAAMLTGLTELKELNLSGSIKRQPVGPAPQAHTTAGGGAQDNAVSSATRATDHAALNLSSVIAALPSLEHLSIHSDAHDKGGRQSSPWSAFPVSARSLAAGSNIQQLTSLQLSGLTDADVQQLSGQVKILRQWDFKSCKGVTVAALPVLAELAEREVLWRVIWAGSRVSEDAAKAAGLPGRLEAISLWRRWW